MNKNILVLAMLFCTPRLVNAQTDTLYVYGPGGPQAAMDACAKIFSNKTAIPVKVIAGPEAKWIEQAKQNADIVFGGAEYMLTQFTMQHPGMIDNSSRTELYKRGAGILVRKGNPKHITSLKDLTKKGIRILDINGAGQLGLWEDLAGKQNLIGGIQKNISRSFPNTAMAIDAWKTDESYDAIISYSSWYLRLKDVAQLVEIPAAQTVYRGTPIAITQLTNQRKDAEQFIQFLLSDERHSIFKKWGWQ
jgi:accessory colonization factor AcfC